VHGEQERYPTDLSNAEWSLLKPYLPTQKRRGRPRIHSPREIVNAVFYLLKSGCQWRMLPREFPPWKTVFHYFSAWRIDGIWERTNQARRRRLREELGRGPKPTARRILQKMVRTV
jgi:putative transposase